MRQTKSPFNLGTIAGRLCGLASAVILALASTLANAADGYLSGTMVDITSVSNGLMVRLDTGVPTNCTGTPYGWLTILETNKTMVALALLAWHSGNRVVTVYTNPTPPGSWCTINQFDPA